MINQPRREILMLPFIAEILQPLNIQIEIISIFIHHYFHSLSHTN